MEKFGRLLQLWRVDVVFVFRLAHEYVRCIVANQPTNVMRAYSDWSSVYFFAVAVAVVVVNVVVMFVVDMLFTLALIIFISSNLSYFI